MPGERLAHGRLRVNDATFVVLAAAIKGLRSLRPVAGDAAGDIIDGTRPWEMGERAGIDVLAAFAQTARVIRRAALVAAGSAEGPDQAANRCMCGSTSRWWRSPKWLPTPCPSSVPETDSTASITVYPGARLNPRPIRIPPIELGG
jgi:hypothetical protein